MSALDTIVPVIKFISIWITSGVEVGVFYIEIRFATGNTFQRNAFGVDI